MGTRQFCTVLTSVCISFNINRHWEQLFLRPKSVGVSTSLYLRTETDDVAVIFYDAFATLEDAECLNAKHI